MYNEGRVELSDLMGASGLPETVLDSIGQNSLYQNVSYMSPVGSAQRERENRNYQKRQQNKKPAKKPSKIVKKVVGAVIGGAIKKSSGG